MNMTYRTTQTSSEHDSFSRSKTFKRRTKQPRHATSHRDITIVKNNLLYTMSTNATDLIVTDTIYRGREKV